MASIDVRITRRRLLRVLAVTSAGLGLLACAPAASTPAKPAAEPAKPAGEAPKPISAPPVAPTVAPVVVDQPADKPDAAKPSAAVQRGGVLVTGMPNHTVSLDPHMSTNGGDEHVFRALYDTLVDMDRDGKVLPKLATSWEVSDKALVFKLRSGVKFHDGTDFDAAAVKANIDRLIDPANKFPYRVAVADVVGAEVVDPMTVKLVMKGPSAPTFPALAGRVGGIMSPAALTKAGKDFQLNPVGSGPFTFVEWIKDNKVTLKRNENYWLKDDAGGQLPYLDGLSMRSIVDDAVRLVELQTGNIHVLETVAPKDVATIKGNNALVYFPIAGQPYDYRMNFNNDKPPFTDKLVRQALSWAVNREVMVKVLAFGAGTASVGWNSPGQWTFDPNTKGYGYDPDKAKALLQQAGLSTPIDIPIVVFTRDEDQLIGQMLQDQLKPIGVNLQIESIERSAGVERLRAGNFLTCIGRFSPEADPDLFLNQYIGGTPNNYWTNYKSAQFDELRNKAAATYDLAQRKALYTELDRLMIEDAPNIQLYKRDWAHAFSNKVQAFGTVPRGIWDLRQTWLAK